MGKKKRTKEKQKKVKPESKKEKSLEDSLFDTGDKWMSSEPSAPGISSLNMDFDA
jgi:hypothetical protein